YPELAKKSESYEICFVPDNDYRGFLKKKMPGLESNVEGGSFVDPEGNIIGKHRGYPFYTIGQRKGLDTAFGKPVYVTAIHPENNTVVLGEEKDLAGQSMMVSGMNMQKYESFPDGMEAVTKIRYKDRGNLSNIYTEGSQLRVHFYEPVKSIAPGQSAVFYEGNDVMGGGIIRAKLNAER
ncbi:MAG TPA: tRNA 2-thiouridine(34) synthase MnmA, partial [Chitinophagaceae bacterium]|nr:tRNA 2-thiouridine(34) synthase MnmA [Chitinophagaceae bacterium]